MNATIARFLPVARVGEIPDGGVKVVRIEDGEIQVRWS